MHADPDAHGHRAGPGPEVDARTPTTRSGPSTSARASSGTTARRSPPTTSSPRWSAWSRPATPASRASSRRAARSPRTRTPSPSPSSARNGNFPYLVSVFNAQTLITPKAYAAGTTLDKVPAGTGAWKLDDATTQQRARRSRATTTGGAARRRSTAPSSSSSTTPARWSPPTRAARSTPSSSSTSCPGASLFDDPNFSVVATADDAPPPDLDAHATRASSRTSRSARPSRYTFDRPALIQQLFKGKASSATTTSSGRATRTSATRSRSARRTSTRPSSSLSDAGATDLTATLHYGQLLEIPDLAVLLKSQAAQAGITLNVGRSRASTPSTARSGARPKPADPPCSGAAELGIVDYGHRATPGRLPQLGAQVEGHLELVAVLVGRLRRRVHGVPDRRSASTPRRPPAPRSRRSSTRTSRSASRTSTTTCPATPRSSRASTRARSGRCSSRRPRRSPDIARVGRRWRGRRPRRR